MSLKEYCAKRVNCIITVVVLTIYVCLTVSSSSFRNFNHDEIHAWNIASNFGFWDIIRLMRSEGHTFIWFMLIKPFTSLSVYSIKWLNWIFTFLAIFLLWIFAPFKTFEKFLITFSCPFLLIYPVVARCYGVGIFLLFLIAVLYKKRFEKPIFFSLLIFLAANTSLMAAIPALILGGIYCFEIYRRKQATAVFTLILLTLLSLYVQWHNPIIPFYTDQYDFNARINDFLLGRFMYGWCKVLASFIYPILLFISFLFFRRNIKILLFWLLSSFTLMLIFVFVYCGFDYHFYFFYIYLILAYWFISGTMNDKISILFSVVFSILSFVFCLKTVSTEWHFKTFYEENAICVMKGVAENSAIYTNLYDYNILLPYIDNSVLKDYEGKELVSFENFQNIYSKPRTLDLQSLYGIANSNSYLLIKSSVAKDLKLDFSKKENFSECGDSILYKFK